MRLAVDTGGTFTDLVVESDDGTLQLFKSPTTPSQPVQGIRACLDLAASSMGTDRAALLGAAEMFTHATTRGINAILTGTTARTAFVTTAGHRDILLYREGGRSDPFDCSREYPPPYIPRRLTFEIEERIGPEGQVIQQLQDQDVLAVIERLTTERVEAVAVCLLWSILNPAHELRTGELIATHLPAVAVTLSHRLNPTIREYRRASSACIDASLKPLMTDYLSDLERDLRSDGFAGRLFVVSSAGGLLDVSAARNAPIHTLGSGPAMAPVAGRHYAQADDLPGGALIVTDTGGTSFEVSLVENGSIPWTREAWLGERYSGDITGFPAIDVKSIGAGGGSIAWVDDGGLLRVGPQSAGAEPGPACYPGGGANPTLTDACVVLGYLDPDRFLNGTIRLNPEAAYAAIDRDVAVPLGTDVPVAASAIVDVATEQMVRTIEETTLYRGVDPAAAVIVGGGGAAGFTISAIARRLGCEYALVPSIGPGLSAAGALVSDLVADYVTTAPTATTRFDFDIANDALSYVTAQAVRFAEVGGETDPIIEHFAEARYPDQVWEIEVPLPSSHFASDTDIEAFRRAFHSTHRRLFGVDDSASPVEILSWRARVTCRVGSHTSALATSSPLSWAAATRRAYFAPTGWVITPVQDLSQLTSGRLLEGPAFVDTPHTTVVVPPGATVRLTESNNLLIDPVGTRAGGGTSLMSTLDGNDTRGIRLAVLSNRFDSVVRAMRNTLTRTSRSGVINVARDFSCAVVSSDNSVLHWAESLPAHVVSGPDLIAKSMMELHPDFGRGDAFLHNSPYHGGGHAADYAIAVPVIDAQGDHRFTVVAKAHQADCGNALPTTYSAHARDVYEEGALIFPCVRVQRDYQDNIDFIRMCQLRIRVPDQWWGDYLALLGAARIGERRLLELGDELGWDTLSGFADEWLGYSEQRMKAAIQALPSGEATVTSVHDPVPAAPDGIPVKVTVRVRSQEAMIDIDLRDNLDCLPCGLNLTECTSTAAAMIGIFNSVADDVPPNGGSARQINVMLRDNCIVGIPRHPASCSVATTNVFDRVVNAVQRALAEIGEGMGMAEIGVGLPPAVSVISGLDPRASNAPFVNQLILAWTGGAGGPLTDGWLTTGGPGDGGALLRDSVEIDEMRHPILIHSQHIVPDSEGAGRRRGAPGGFVEFGPRDTRLEAIYLSDGTANPPRGARRGMDGSPARQYRREPDGTLTELEAIGHVQLQPGETILSYTTGGAGFGAPIEREPERVLTDVREGWVSAERAATVYGVVISDDEIDHPATAARRQELKKHTQV